MAGTSGLLMASCSGQARNGGAQKEVVVYTALDEEFSAPILDDFARSTGITSLAKYDVESTKTVGLVSEIIAEARQPRCDVFWNNEILNTLRLEKLGLLQAYQSPAAAAFDPRWKSRAGSWCGFAARARILLVNKSLIAGKKKPESILDLTDSQWRGQIAIAKPLFGTTATQAACLFAVWGDEKAKDYFRQLKANGVQVLGGNKRVAEAVAAGQFAFGLTDTDDAMGEIDQGMPVEIVYPDQGADGVGTLFIPNTVMIIKGGPHPEAARALIDYLLSPAVETKLAEGASVQIPLNPEVHAKLRVETPQTIKAMQVDFSAAADKWDAAAKFLRDEFTSDE
ncbi:MAG TPA: extracellular solute-binding protein [Pirellulales bacterium]